jgi:lysyl-tRNA synthetase class 2
MATLKDYRDERLRKLAELKQLGVNPYPAKVSRTHDVADVTKNFSSLEGQDVTIVGRIKSIRKFGKIAFIVIRDQSGEVQLFWRAGIDTQVDRGNGELLISDIALLDSGDFVEAYGPVIKTQTGEISVEVRRLRLLTKALRPMPSEQEGFSDKEQRMRRRYVDMNVNRQVRDRFVRRSRFWQATRDFLNERGFLEINIPVLEHTTGGADANPFVTHMDALDHDFYLRISHELPLKRLIGAGYEKVYDIGPRFRNENYSDEHLPEHVAMEWYWAYADWEQGMDLMEEMFREVLQKTFGTLVFNLGGKEVDMGRPWERWDYASVIRERYGIEVFDCTIEQVKEQLNKHGLEVEKTENIARGIDKLWKNIRKDVVGPVWLINTPVFISPLAKADDKNPAVVQRFQAVIAGSELCNGYSELNDPLDQLARFTQQEAMREAGDAEAMMLDIDFVEMLEYGMPPTCGLGYSERVFWIFEGVTAREGVPFPQLRSEVDEVTRSIYPDLYK